MTTSPLCTRCHKTLACTLAPGEVGMHAACSHAATAEAWAALDAAAVGRASDALAYGPDAAREPTYRLVGVRRDGSRQVLRSALSEIACCWERNDRNTKWKRAGFVRFRVERE